MVTNHRFFKSILGYSKMDIYKCPIFISWKRIWSKISYFCNVWAHIPHNPHTHKWHTIIFSLLLLFKIELYTLASWHRARSALIPFSFYSTISSIHLLYSFKREISPSWESRNEWQIEIWVTTILAPLHHTLRLLAPLFSLLNNNSREKTIHTPLYPFLGTPEMSDKLRYEWQIILRYYPHIIHEVPLERPATNPRKTIHLERQTTPHLLSHWTTHLQYRRNYYAYSRTQQSLLLSWSSYCTTHTQSYQTRRWRSREKKEFLYDY
jgi:hypothetical protein